MIFYWDTLPLDSFVKREKFSIADLSFFSMEILRSRLFIFQIFRYNTTSMKDFEGLRTKAKKEIQSAADSKTLELVFKKYLGRAGELTDIFRSLKDLPERERRTVGKMANELRSELQALFEKRTAELRKKTAQEQIAREWIDITVPGTKILRGHLHPLTLVARNVQDIFQQMGFSVVSGPEVEDEWHNFDALNIPSEHPARDMWNTLWLKPQKSVKFQTNLKSQKSLLRTHTSPVQIRYMEKNNPPLRIIAPGRVFRHEATDASHEINFYQVEGLMVDRDVSIAHFKAIIQEFFIRFFGKEAKIRLRPSYFPFVEPGFEVDIICNACRKIKTKNQKSKTNPSSQASSSQANCSVCHGAGWLEMMGAGMVHPAVFEAVKLNPQEWQGFAFGIGLDRLAMMKYKINDIRLFYEGDLRFLRQF
jgi:phenylalanyl-tRNA synthetase alpha chain